MTTPTPTATADRSSRPEPSASPGHFWLAAAIVAVLALVATGAVWVLQHDGDPTPPRGTGPDRPTVLRPWTLGVGIDLPDGATIKSVDVGRDGTGTATVYLAGGGQFTVSVRGGTPQREDDGNIPSDNPRPAVLVGDDEVVTVAGFDVDAEQLQAFTERVDVDGQTAVRIPLGAQGLPAGATITHVSVQYESYDAGPDVWHVDLSLDWTGHEDSVSVSLSQKPLTDAEPSGEFEVNGHPAYGYPGFGAQFYVDQENGSYLDVSAVLPADGSSLDREQLTALAEAFTVVADPADRAGWIVTADALP